MHLQAGSGYPAPEGDAGYPPFEPVAADELMLDTGEGGAWDRCQDIIDSDDCLDSALAVPGLQSVDTASFFA